MIIKNAVIELVSLGRRDISFFVFESFLEVTRNDGIDSIKLKREH